MSARPSRRTVLRGAGVALALPWLESLAPRDARGQTAPASQTYVAMVFPEGTTRFWKPQTPGSGDGWTLSPVLEPLTPFKSHVNVLANVGNYGPFGGHVEPAHGNQMAAVLTCTKAQANGPDNATCGTSIDQVLAQAWSGRTKLDSLQVGLSTLDSYTDGMPAACSRSISWRSPTDPTFKIVDPQIVFDKIVGAGDLTPAQGDGFALARRAKNKSVLDYVLGHATSVRGQVGRSDRPRLDQFLDSVRALETSIGASAGGPACAVDARPPEAIGVGMVPPDYDRDVHADIMIDLVAMALACDVTRVVSFLLDDARSDFVYSFLPVRHFTDDGWTPSTGTVGGLHGVQQSGDDNDAFSTVSQWFVAKLARLCGALQATATARGTMLDDTAIYFGSSTHGGNNDGLDLPTLTVGKGGGAFRTDQYVDFATTGRRTERLANLHLTFLREVFGLPVSVFGSGAPMHQPSVGETTPPYAFGDGTAIIPEILGYTPVAP